MLPIEEYLVPSGDMNAFKEKLEEGGFEAVGEPFPVEKNGHTFAWWQKSVQMSIESGDLTPAPAGAARAEDAGGGLPTHLTSGNLASTLKVDKKSHSRREKKRTKINSFGAPELLISAAGKMFAREKSDAKEGTTCSCGSERRVDECS